MERKYLLEGWNEKTGAWEKVAIYPSLAEAVEALIAVGIDLQWRLTAEGWVWPK